MVPSPYGAPAAVETLSTVAAPLLGGFSITLAGVVLQASDRFRYPGVALLLLAMAGALLLLCVQCGFWARHHYTTPEEASAWWPDYANSAARQQMVFLEQARSYVIFRRWSGRARRSYRYGIVTLLLGFMVTLMPRGAGFQETAQWAAVWVVGLAVAGELLWMASASPRLRRWLPRKVADWFAPQADPPRGT